MENQIEPGVAWFRGWCYSMGIIIIIVIIIIIIIIIIFIVIAHTAQDIHP